MTDRRIRIDWGRCTGRLVCAGLLPEMVDVDDWGYPVVADKPVPAHLLRHARRARAACPALALKLEKIRRRESTSE